MSTYRFQLKDYHAVKSSDIIVDGITVISGLNGTGKSTVARWLYYVTNVLCNYDAYVEKEGEIRFSVYLQNLRHAVMSLGGPTQTHRMIEILDKVRSMSPVYLPDMIDIVESVRDLVGETLMESLPKEKDEASIKRYEQYFNVLLDDADSMDEYISKVKISILSDYKDILEESLEKLSNHTLDNFREKLISQLNFDLDGPDSFEVNLLEDEVNLMGEEAFTMPLNLRNVVYINTQNLANTPYSPFSDNPLEGMLTERRDITLSVGAKAIARYITRLIGGDVEVEKKKGSGFGSFNINRSKLMFVSKSGQSFNLRGAATGVISFSYLLQLLKNGWIDENTLLIIDEPECHLHPTWIVDYARMLVLIQKHIGAKIVISSHNPDMVSAIQAIAAHEGIIDRVNYYLAQPAPDSDGQYEFRCLGSEIAEIFDAFNVSIERINAFLPKEE